MRNGYIGTAVEFVNRGLWDWQRPTDRMRNFAVVCANLWHLFRAQ